MEALPRWLRWAGDRELVRRADLLARSPLFAGLPRRLRGRLAALLFEKRYEAGDVVFREGDPGKGLFIVLAGAVAITRSGPQGERELVRLGPGEVFGELALIDDLPRSATARVVERARLLILYRSHFDALLDGDRAAARILTRNLLRRLAAYVRRAHGSPEAEVRWEGAGSPPP